MDSTFVGIADEPIIALALLRLKHAKLCSLPCTTREQAIAIIRGIRPAPPRKLPLVKTTARCVVCHRPIPVGSLCDSLGRMHIECSNTKENQ